MKNRQASIEGTGAEWHGARGATLGNTGQPDRGAERKADRQTGRWTRGKAGRQIGGLAKAQGQSGREPKEPYWVIPTNKTVG